MPMPIKERLVQWLMDMVQLEVNLDNALQTFHLATDKEVATMAAYRAMGIDPATAPKFGWNLSDRRGINVTQHITEQNSLRGNGRGALILSAVLSLLGGAGLTLGMQHWLAHQAPATQEYDIDFRIEDGQLKVEPPRKVNP
jgi:hypothetical protein